MRDAVIVSTARTPIGKAYRGAFNATTPQALAAHAGGELLVIGGGELYRQALAKAQRIYLTLVHTRVDGDTWFPDYDPAEFRETERVDHPADAQHAHAYSFVTLERSLAAARA